MAQHKDHLALAAEALGFAEDADPDAKPEDVALMLQFIQARATLAVAAELRSVRESIDGVADALKSQDGYGAGISLYYISDWLKTIAEKR